MTDDESNLVVVKASELTEQPRFSLVGAIRSLPDRQVVRIDHESMTVDIRCVEEDWRNVYSWDKPYYIRLEEFRNARDLCRWIAHCGQKLWFTREHAVQLCWAFERINLEATDGSR